MRSIKRIATSILIIMIFLAQSFLGVSVNAISYYEYKSKYESFINDERWCNDASWGSEQMPLLSTWKAWGCCAYVMDYASYVFGVDDISGYAVETDDVSQIKSGDIIYGYGTWDQHYFVVLERDGDKLYTAEGSWASAVRISDSAYYINGDSICYTSYGSETEFKLSKIYHFDINSDIDMSLQPEVPIITVYSKTSQDNTIFVWSGTANTTLREYYLYNADTGEKLDVVSDIRDRICYASLPAGNYEITPVALNESLVNTGNWWSVGETVSFTVEEGEDRAVNRVDYNGHTYEFYNNRLTWLDARQKCEEKGGYLASITDNEESEALKSFISQNGMYIGAIYEPLESEWKWVTQESFDYSNWKSEQQDSECETFDELDSEYEIEDFDEKNYGFICNDGLWNNTTNISYEIDGFICEYDTILDEYELPENASDTDEVIVIYGDVDGDKQVTMLDVVAVQKQIAKLSEFTYEQEALADVNHDDLISMLDVTIMQRYIARLIEEI